MFYIDKPTVLIVIMISSGVWETDFFVQRLIELEANMTPLLAPSFTSIKLFNDSLLQLGGKKLGPLLFVLFVTDLLNIFVESPINLFVDDRAICTDSILWCSV